MRIENPQSQEELYIYSAKLKFTKEKNGQVSKDMVRVVIRYGQRGPKRKKDLEVPKEINTGELEWRRYKGKNNSEYRRTGNSQDYDYEDSITKISIPTAIRHKLEGLVKEVCFEEIIRYIK